MLFLTTYRVKPYLPRSETKKLLDLFGKVGAAPGTIAHYVAADNSVGTTVKPWSRGSRRLMLEIVRGEVIDAARADLWASSLGQVDTRSSARTQNPRHQVG